MDSKIPKPSAIRHRIQGLVITCGSYQAFIVEFSFIEGEYIGFLDSVKEDLVAENYGTGKTIAKVLGVDIKQDDPDLPIATTETLGGVIVGENLSITETGVLSAEKDDVKKIIDETLLNYQHMPYINTETVAADYKTLEMSKSGDEHEYTVNCDSLLCINVAPNKDLVAQYTGYPAESGTPDVWHFYVYNTFLQAFQEFYATSTLGFWEATVINGDTSAYPKTRKLSGVLADSKCFYIQAGSRIKYEKTSASSSETPVTLGGSVRLVPIKKHNEVTSKKFIPDCTITLNPSSYSMNFDNYSSESLTPEVTVVDPDGNTLTKDVDYVVAYAQNVMPVYYAQIKKSTNVYRVFRSNTTQGIVVITGIGEWTSSVTKTFDKTFTDNKSCIVYAVYGTSTGHQAYASLTLDESKLPGTVVFEGGEDAGLSKPVEVGGFAGNWYGSKGKKYFKFTDNTGTTTRDYLEIL